MARTRFEVAFPGARKVGLAGDFNEWSPRPMKRVKKGSDVFVAVVDLAPGEYQYKYVVDGEWRCSPDSLRTANTYGTDNCVLQVPV